MIIYTLKVIFLNCRNLAFLPLLECKKRKSKSHGKCKNGNIKRKICTEKRKTKDLSTALKNHEIQKYRNTNFIYSRTSNKLTLAMYSY